MMEVLWWVCGFIIVEAMIGYPVSLFLLDKLLKKPDNKKDNSFEPTVTIMVVAHNEEKVIGEKLNNLIGLDYPNEKIKILVASDFSTDSTNEIVEDFISLHKERNISLYKSVEHFGKTNAQNEAQELVDSEILVMTDANAILDKRAIKELVSSFSSDEIVYVSGQLKYINSAINDTAESEGFYWRIDLFCRLIESKIQTITAGNGAIYACRNKDYVKIEPIGCHDGSFPLLYALDGKRAIYNPDAIAYEKAGETIGDEFKRKVRMNRTILKGILSNIKVLDVYHNRWFSYFYFGHRTCRYLLWIAHLLLFIFNLFLLKRGIFWILTMIFQCIFYVISFIGWRVKSNNRIVKIISYYTITVLAQWNGVINILTGKTKPVWEKVESTR